MLSKVSIIIVNKDGRDLLDECLNSLFSLTVYPTYIVIVVDNASSDGSVELVKEKFPQVEIITLHRNYGFTKANNIAIKYAIQNFKPDYVFLLNNDTKIIQRDWLEQLVKCGYQIVQPIILNKDRSVQSKGGGIIFFGVPYLIKDKEQPLWVSFAAVLISREVLEKIGLLAENYIIYAEDLEFCLRARACGFKIGVANTQIIHYGTSTIMKLAHDKHVYYYYKTRNDYWTIAKYYSSRIMKLGYIAFSILQSLILLLKRNTRGSKSVIVGLFHALRSSKTKKYYSLPPPKPRLSVLLIAVKRWLENSLRS